jgi:hypothetical protein
MDEQLNPFQDQIVTEPRRIETTVTSLNATALHRLMDAFKKIQNQSKPRLSLTTPIEVVLSAEPGYGKSHLLGRLLQQLTQQATLIYLRPFQDPESAWILLLDRIMAEVRWPEAQSAHGLHEMSQFDALASHVLISLLHRVQATCPLPSHLTEIMKSHPVALFKTPTWRAWFDQHRRTTLAHLETALTAHALQLRPNNHSWLTVLMHYVTNHDAEQRELALAWLTHQPLDGEERQLLGVTRRDVLSEDTPYATRNEHAFARIRDLFCLSAFYRPFVLCFDQSELYLKADHFLAREFGVVLSRLRREVPNHLTIATGNQNVWQQIVSHFEIADQHALNPNPIHLEGINFQQATELLKQYLHHHGISDEISQTFLQQHNLSTTENWLASLFTEKRTLGVRHILIKASERWANRAPPSLAQSFAEYCTRRPRDHRPFTFDAGMFQLLVTDILGPALGMTSEEITQRQRSGQGYFTMRWAGAEQAWLFSFETGHHWKRWQAILDQAQRYYKAGQQAQQPVQARLFRTKEQQALPQRIQNRLQEATAYCQVIELSQQDMMHCYAAHDLFADVEQGNHQFQKDETLTFLQQQPALIQLAQRIVAGEAPQPLQQQSVPDLSPLSALICDVMQTTPMMTMPILQERLAEQGHLVEPPTILATLQQISEICIHSSSINTIMLWQPN